MSIELDLSKENDLISYFRLGSNSIELLEVLRITLTFLDANIIIDCNTDSCPTHRDKA